MIQTPTPAEPDQAGSVFYVGQDRAGHWLVQESHGLLEGRFISAEAAWHFARTEVHAFPGPAITRSACDPACETGAERDPRWRALAARLESLREAGRRAIRIVDVNCGDGTLLIHAAWRARVLGFLAIEAQGVDRSPARIDEARRRAEDRPDLAIGMHFECTQPLTQLAAEADFPADIVLYEASARAPEALLDAVRRAGKLALRRSPSRDPRQ